MQTPSSVVIAPVRQGMFVEIAPGSFVNLEFIRAFKFDLDGDKITGVWVNVEGFSDSGKFNPVHAEYVQEVITLCQAMRIPKANNQIVQAPPGTIIN